jgi:DNA-directed RNA polymerase specialized sigma subunit
MKRAKSKRQLASNFNTSSYIFGDLDLEIAVKSLELKDREITILYLMGHSQKEIGEAIGLDRSMISKRLKIIISMLTEKMKR